MDTNCQNLVKIIVDRSSGVEISQNWENMDKWDQIGQNRWIFIKIDQHWKNLGQCNAMQCNAMQCIGLNGSKWVQNWQGYCCLFGFIYFN